MEFDLITPIEAGELLHKSQQTLAIWRSVRKKQRRYRLPYVKLGGKIFYRRLDIQKFIESCVVTGPEKQRA